jgi:iron complex outermembrane receptor protein
MVDGSPLPSASITLIELKHPTFTDEQGNYSYKNIPEGTYHIKIQVLGAAEQDIEAIVKGGETTIINYQLPKENVMALQEVTITSDVNRFSKKKVNM